MGFIDENLKKQYNLDTNEFSKIDIFGGLPKIHTCKCVDSKKSCNNPYYGLCCSICGGKICYGEKKNEEICLYNIFNK